MSTPPQTPAPTATRSTSQAPTGHSETSEGASLSSRAARGTQWVLASAVAEKLLSLATLAVLARILSPAEFGLFALAFVAMDALGALKNLGLDAAIVQRRDRVEQAANAAFFLLPIVSGSLSVLLFLFSGPVARWLGTPAVAGPLRGLSFALVLVSLGAVPNALLQKRMRFRARVTATMIGALAFSVTSIILALAGWGVWGLVCAHLMRTALTSTMCWLQVDWRPRPEFDRRLLGEMLGFSLYVMAANVLSVAAGSVDKIVVGRLLGPTAVGYYSLAYGLAFVIRGQIGPRLYQVAFPAFTEAQDDPERLRRGLLRVVQGLLTVAVPYAVVLGVLSRDVLAVVYGPQWTVAAGVLTALAFGAAATSLNSALQPLLLARGRSKAQFLMNVAEVGVFLAMAPVAIARWGLVGAGAAYAASATGAALLGAAVASRDLSLSGRAWMKVARFPLLAGAAMFAFIAAARALVAQWLPDPAPLWAPVLVGAGGAIAYGLLLWRLAPEIILWVGGWLLSPLPRGVSRRSHES